MPKNFFQDMVKIKNENRERLKQEFPSSVHQSPGLDDASSHVQPSYEKENYTKAPSVSVSSDSEHEAEPFIETKFSSVSDFTERPNSTKKPKGRLWIVAVLCSLIFLYSISLIFSKIVVTVNPKIQEIFLNQNLFASLDAGVDALSFDLVAISGEEEKIVQGGEVKDISKKSEGVVIIYNTFSSKTQRLDIDTRLEGSNGKIYKTKKQIVVPGMKGSTPGSIEVGVYGAEAGEAYNSGPLDFTIFGFKGTPKYSKFYARSKGAIAGGFEGKTSVISDTEKSTAINDLKNTLQTKLSKKALEQVPEGFVLFKDASFLDINDNMTPTSSENNMLSIKVKATLYGLLFNEEKLTKEIAEDKIPQYDGSAVYIQNIQDLNFSISKKDNVSFKDMKNINFNLSGSTKIVWKLDEGKLATDLLGKSKKYFSQVLLQYPNVDSADLVISPFWKMSLPNKAKDIKVIVNYPK